MSGREKRMLDRLIFIKAMKFIRNVGDQTRTLRDVGVLCRVKVVAV